MNGTTHVLIASIIGVCGSTSTQAQGLAGDVSSVSTGAPLNKPGDLLGGAQLLAAKGSSSATIKLSKVTSVVGSDDVARFNTFSLSASAPLDKSGGDSITANLDGLASAANIEFGYSGFATRAVRNATFAMLKLPKIDAICRRAYEARKVKTLDAIPEKMDCDSTLVETYGSPEDKHAFESAFFDVDKEAYRWLWGVNGKAGFQNYKYVTASGTTEQKTNGKPWSVGLWGAVQPGDRDVLLLLNAQYQRAFKEGDARTVCPVPAQGATSTACIAGPLDAPKEITKHLVTAEVRTRISGIGIALSVTRDFKGKTTGAELPIYFVADKDGKLTAGLKVGWTNEKKETTVGVFIGTPFGIFK